MVGQGTGYRCSPILIKIELANKTEQWTYDPAIIITNMQDFDYIHVTEPSLIHMHNEKVQLLLRKKQLLLASLHTTYTSKQTK